MQTSRNLAEEAAWHICLTMGWVLLVVTIDIIHEPNTRPRKLHSVTWPHWEEDVGAYGMVTKQDDEEVNEVRAERRQGEDNTLHVLPPATAFSALMSVPGDDKRYRVRVTETVKWELFADPKISRINILHRRLYRDPDDEDWDTLPFIFSDSAKPFVCLDIKIVGLVDQLNKNTNQHVLLLKVFNEILAMGIDVGQFLDIGGKHFINNFS